MLLYVWEIRCESVKGISTVHKVVDNVDDALLAVSLSFVQLFVSVFIFLLFLFLFGILGFIHGLNLRRVQNFEGRLSILNDLLQVFLFFDNFVDFV